MMSGPWGRLPAYLSVLLFDLTIHKNSAFFCDEITKGWESLAGLSMRD